MTAATATIDVLMATYEGAAFLREQIDSIFAQPHGSLRLLVRDDGSTDATRAIVADYAARRPEMVVLVDPDGPHLGACGSFARLLELSTADYVMLCDQDDVWLPGKVSAMLSRMRELEGQFGRQTPLLVHGDLIVVDESLRTLHKSFWRSQGLDPRRGAVLNRLLVENVVAGCSAMLNRALVATCLPIPATAVMHDWWIALVAAVCGRLECLPEATAHYRQHAANCIGTKRPWLGRRFRRITGFFGDEGFRGHLAKTQRQAQTLLERFGPRLDARQRAVVAAYATLGNQGWLARRRLLLRHGFRSASWIGNAKLLAGI